MSSVECRGSGFAQGPEDTSCVKFANGSLTCRRKDGAFPDGAHDLGGRRVNSPMARGKRANCPKSPKGSADTTMDSERKMVSVKPVWCAPAKQRRILTDDEMGLDGTQFLKYAGMVKVTFKSHFPTKISKSLHFVKCLLFESTQSSPAFHASTRWVRGDGRERDAGGGTGAGHLCTAG